ncbi:ribonuclease H-like domain-containing protein [Tanacetum coccineum]|uniref:Ribonuclease H-like domain-containing protein n=1 Tax=Tanacetum coccineum TaxID=301880 RepID=A0ABQ5DGL3_9ASTR
MGDGHANNQSKKVYQENMEEDGHKWSKSWFDKSKVECYNCHKHRHFARVCRFPRNQENKGRENNTRTIEVETPTQNALIAQDGIGGYDWSYQAEKEKHTNHALMAFTSSGSSSSSDSEFKTGLGYDVATAASPAVEIFVNLTDKSGSDKGYHFVPPPLTGNFILRKPDLTFMDEIVESENLDVTTVVTPCNDKTVENKGVSNTVESNIVRMNNTSASIIEDWNSDDKSEIDYTVRPSTKKIKSVKTVRETDAPKQNKHNPRGNQRNWNNLMSQRLGSDFKMTNKACYDCGSFEHLHYVCDKKVERTVWNNSRRVNHKNFTNKMTHPHPKRSFVPQAVLTKSGKLSTAGAAVNTVRSVNTAASKPIVNHPRTKTNAFKRGYSQSSRPFNRHFANKNSIINTNVNTARVKHTTARDRAVVSENKGKGANAVKASACWGNPQQKEYKEKVVIDSGCSRHMTRNKCYLDEYEDYDDGFVSFGDGKGRIFRKGKIKTGSLDFDDVYFCKELKFNPFSVSQICDKKNNVLFTDTECLVLSSNFKLLDESQVLLRVPRKDNIYSVDLKSVVPTGGLTCFIAKAIIDESNTWHKRLGHINFKIMNKLVKENLIKGKFDGKANEGYFVGYSVVSKAMRVFNKRTRIVEETLNIRFLENTTNVKGSGLDWLFDIDSLTVSMNYVPVAAGNKINGPKDCKGDARTTPTEVDENEASDKSGKHDQEARSESERLNLKEMQTKHTNSSNGINTISTPVSTVGPLFDTVVPSTPVNTVGPSVSTANESEEQLFERFSPFKNAFTLPPVPNVSSMDNTGIFGNAYDDEDLEEEVDMKNVISSYSVPDTSFTKFYKDHLEDQVNGSLKTPVQTRHMTKIIEEHGLFSSVHKLR